MSPNTGDEAALMLQDGIIKSEVIRYPLLQTATLKSEDSSKLCLSAASISDGPLGMGSVDPSSQAADLASAPVVPASRTSWSKYKRQYAPILCFFAVFVMYLARLALSHGQYVMQDEMGWTEGQIGFIQSSFYIGYLPTQLIGGHFSRTHSAKYVNLWGLLLSCLACALTPVCVSVYPLMIVLRILMGFGQGVMYPAMAELLSHWLLPGERGFFLNLAWSGGQAGTIFVFAIHPIIIHHLNWQWGFYLFSLSGLVWTVCWMLFVFDTPDAHPSLSTEERSLLARQQQRSLLREHADSLLPLSEQPSQAKAKVKIPWSMLLSAPPIYTLMIIYFCYNWTFYLFINNIPTYQRNVLSVDPKLLSATTMVPYVLLWITLLASGIISDALVRRGLPLLRVRKLMVCIGFLPCAILLAFVKLYVQHSISLTLVMTTLAVGISGISMSGFSPNPMDLAPQYAGVITSLCNVFGSTSGIIGPIFTAAIFKRYGCEQQANTEACHSAWNLLFLIASAIYLLGAVIWLLFASARSIQLTKRVLGQA